jgi:hypothetical protein
VWAAISPAPASISCERVRRAASSTSDWSCTLGHDDGRPRPLAALESLPCLTPRLVSVKPLLHVRASSTSTLGCLAPWPHLPRPAPPSLCGDSRNLVPRWYHLTFQRSSGTAAAQVPGRQNNTVDIDIDTDTYCKGLVAITSYSGCVVGKHHSYFHGRSRAVSFPGRTDI